MSKRTRFATQLVILAAAALLAAACSNSTSPAAKPASAASAPQPKPAEPAHESKTGSPGAEAPPKAPLLEQEVAYGEAQKRNLVGFLAMPGDAAEPLPGLIVIHEWWGLNDNIKAMTRKLASEGYVALAVDLYNGAKADTPEKAQPLMAAVVGDQEAARANLKQAYDYLDKYALAPRIGSVGWSPFAPRGSRPRLSARWPREARRRPTGSTSLLAASRCSSLRASSGARVGS